MDLTHNVTVSLRFLQTQSLYSYYDTESSFPLCNICIFSCCYFADLNGKGKHLEITVNKNFGIFE